MYGGKELSINTGYSLLTKLAICKVLQPEMIEDCIGVILAIGQCLITETAESEPSCLIFGLQVGRPKN